MLKQQAMGHVTPPPPPPLLNRVLKRKHSALVALCSSHAWAFRSAAVSLSTGPQWVAGFRVKEQVGEENSFQRSVPSPLIPTSYRWETTVALLSQYGDIKAIYLASLLYGDSSE